MYIYFSSYVLSISAQTWWRCVHPKTLENAGLIPTGVVPVSNLSAPEILQRPAPQQGARLFGGPRPKRPRAAANPGWCMLHRPAYAPGLCTLQNGARSRPAHAPFHHAALAHTSGFIRWPRPKAASSPSPSLLLIS